jgi:MFS family permease
MPFIICILGSFFYVYDYFLAVAPSIITHNLLNEFSLNAAELGSLMAIFFLASTFFQIPAGMLLDRFGARKLLTLSVLVSGLGTLLFAVATQAWELGAARLLMGIGSPFAFLGALFLGSRWFAHRHFALIAGCVQLGAAIGSIAGEGPLALLVNHLGWRHALLAIGWITLVLSLLFWLIIRDGERADSACTEVKPARLRDTFKLPQVWWISLAGFASWVTVTGIASLWGIPYLMAVYGWNNEKIGYLYILFWLGLGLGSPLMGWVSDALKSRKIPFYICFGLGFIACLFYIEAPHIPGWAMVIVLIMLGFAASLQSLTFGIAKDIVPPQHFVTASGLINLAAVLTGVVIQPIMGYLIDHSAKARGMVGTQYQIADYQNGFIVIAAVLFVGLIITYFGLKETHCQNQDSLPSA